MDFDFQHQRNQRAEFFAADTLDCGEAIGSVSARDLTKAASQFALLTEGACAPQLALLVYAVTRQPRALDWYFPITRALSPADLARFDESVERLTRHPHFDLRLMGPAQSDWTEQMPPGVPQLVAGHLAEVFFGRPDLLNVFLAAPRRFRLYATPQAFRDDGGEAGGSYHAERETLQLLLARLFEGYYGPVPGVAPFLHELGHMLDFASRTPRGRQPEGLLPGLHPKGPGYTPRARALFVKGKRLEVQRYLAHYHGSARPGDPAPIGHPYVFQNDTEFIAGYFEMFFRNPNYFAERNADLYQGLVELFGYDPRAGWPEDFDFYIQQNQEFYSSGQQPWKPGVTVPEA